VNTVIVNPLPIQYSLTGGGEYCSGGTGVLVGLTDTEAGVSYQLFNNGNPVGTPVNGTGSPFSFGLQILAGTYTVVGSRIADGCVSSMSNSVAVTINPLPVVNAGSDFSIPHGISTTLNGSASGGSGIYSYSWSPVANIASGSNTLTPLTTNLYTATNFSLVVTDSKGCTANDQITVSLSGSALSIAASASPFLICSGGLPSQLFCNASGGSGVYSYSWTCIPAGIPAWTSTLQNPWVSPLVTTTYFVHVNDGYNTSADTINVVVSPLP